MKFVDDDDDDDELTQSYTRYSYTVCFYAATVCHHVDEVRLFPETTFYMLNGMLLLEHDD